MSGFVAVVVLPLRFAWALVTSGVRTVGVILRTGLRLGPPPPAGFVRMAFAPMSARGAALLGCMITLTPGTSVIDVDLEAREMLLHMLDTSDAASVVEAIRREFEPGLVALFGVSA